MEWKTKRYAKKWAVVLIFSFMAGLVGGIGAVMFRLMIRFFHSFFFSTLLPHISFYIGGVNLGYIILPAIGGVLIAPLIMYAPNIRGNGIPEVIEAFIFRDGTIHSKFAILKIIATSIAIGSGASLGREGPIGFIGASLSSVTSQLFKLPKEMKKLLTACGLAAGIAGTFNAPFAGAIFALEVLYMGAFSLNLVPIFIASITGNAVTLALLDSASGIVVPSSLGYAISELPFFFLLGILSGLLAALFVKSLYLTIDKFESSRVPLLPRLVIGGMIVGFLGMLFPEYGILGIGYEGMRLAMFGLLPLYILLMLIVLKIFATIFSVASGYSGGIFAPSLYIGTAFGAAFGMILRFFLPWVDPSSYALAGMAAFFSGVAQAPINQILMVAELTKNYTMVPPAMLSSVAGFLSARVLLKGSSIYTLKLERKGIQIKTGKPVILETISVKDIMTKEPVFVYSTDPISHVEKLIAKTGHDCFPVVDENMNVIGIIGVRDLIKCPSRDIKVREFINRPYTVTYPTETAQQAFEKLMVFNQNILPVVESPKRNRLIGVITKRDIYKAYYRGLEGMYIE
ncbi:MAG: chloride channel protein [Thermococcus sp.]|uniref:chloride channel protein n=1 Tax=Thermococcus sp. TaxID=35749 RepID=UPI001DAFE409|nr:chloride channel protein [Thermococcus sp.]MBO8174739.1 chloride channel protein [Thermococcus sp.]